MTITREPQSHYQDRKPVAAAGSGDEIPCLFSWYAVFDHALFPLGRAFPRSRQKLLNQPFLAVN